MAKSLRSSSKKANNQRLASTLYGPAERARAERLSAKLAELAKQPKPETSDVNMEAEPEEGEEAEQEQRFTKMDVDSSARSKPRGIHKRIDKRKQKKASIVFPKYSDRVKAKNKKKGKSN